MRTNSKPAVEKSTIKNPLPLVILFFALLNLSFSYEDCKANSWSDDTAYISMANGLIRESLQDCNSQVVWLDGIELQTAPLICTFYAKNDYMPFWTKGNELNSQSIAVLDLLKNSYKYGFEPSNFDIVSLEHFRQSLLKEDKAEKSASMRVRFEFLMTNSVFAFMSYLTQGTEYSNSKDAFVRENPIVNSFPEYLLCIRDASDIDKEILKLQPEDADYVSLQNEMKIIISNMETSENSISIPNFEEDPTRVFTLFSYIFSSEGLADKAQNIADPKSFTAILIEFQIMAGIRSSGKIDNATRRVAVNLIKAKYESIAKKLEKIRKRTSCDESLISCI